MKRIICLIDSLNQGGAQRQIVGLASFLTEKGYDVTLVWYHNEGFYFKDVKEKGIKYLNPKTPQNPISKFLSVRGVMKRLKPDVVVSYLGSPNIISCLLKMFGGKFKLIVSERVLIEHLSTYYKVAYFLYRNADKIVSNSHAQTQFLSSTYPNLKPKCETITNFVYTDKFVPKADKEFRETKEIVVVARITPEKNVLSFLNAVCKVKKRIGTFKITWYGAKSIGEYYDKCLQRIKELNISDCFSFHQPTLEIAWAYQNADFFCLPSLREGYANVLCEAMSCGLPIVCSDVSDNPRIVENNYNGFLFNPKDENDMSEKICMMLSQSPQNMKIMGDRSRELSLKKHSKEAFIQKYIDIIETI